MERDKIVEYTPEGFQEVAEALTFLPEEQRIPMLSMFVMMLTS